MPYKSHFESMQAAKSWGFKISDHAKLCSGIDEVHKFINHWDKERFKLPYDIDGIVIKVNDYKQQKFHFKNIDSIVQQK